MLYLSMEEIDRFIKEDVPYIDITSWVMGIHEQEGRIAYFTRDAVTVCGTEEVQQIFARLRINTESMIPSGQQVDAGTSLIVGTGRAEDLHMAWKVGQNILDHCCGIATKTKNMVKAAKSVLPTVEILTTRKGFPGTKALSIKSILVGGAIPHRLGISETVLIFQQHRNFVGGIEGILQKLPDIKQKCCEKKVIVETNDYEEAVRLCTAGASGIQFDKIEAKKLTQMIEKLRTQFPHAVFLAAGGINENNIKEYAATGADGLVTTSLYHVKPADIGVKIALL